MWKIPLIIISLLLIVAIAYVVYVFVDYNRIEDNVAVEPQGTAELSAVKTGTEYTALTYNVGFGAYTPDFTFFMDGGKSSWAESKESVIACIDGAAGVIGEHKDDFALIQEVDFDSTRSCHVDERAQLIGKFPAELIPEGFSRVTAYKSGLRPSTRNTDIPYSPESFVVTLDGFIVSDNVQPDYVDVVDTGFLYSDHNPVELRFKLK